jgi:hypothetical protein
MFKDLEPEQRKLFRVFWYTGMHRLSGGKVNIQLRYYFQTAKDMCRPLNASKKQRNCHVKIMIIDEHIGIQGNGNQGVFYSGFFHP